MKTLSISFIITILIAIPTFLSADSVKINKTGTIYQNVKTSVESGVVTVNFEDGSQKQFRTRDVTVTPGEVVWLAEEEVEPSFLERWFGTSKASKQPGSQEQNTTSAGSTNSAEGTDSEEVSSIPYLGEGIFGGVALLFLILP